MPSSDGTVGHGGAERALLDTRRWRLKRRLCCWFTTEVGCVVVVVVMEAVETMVGDEDEDVRIWGWPAAFIYFWYARPLKRVPGHRAASWTVVHQIIITAYSSLAQCSLPHCMIHILTFAPACAGAGVAMGRTFAVITVVRMSGRSVLHSSIVCNSPSRAWRGTRTP